MSTSAGVLGSRLAVAVTSVIVTTVVVAGGIAVASVPNNSVNSAKIVDNTIQSIDIRNGTIQSIDIKNGSVGIADVAPVLQPLFARFSGGPDGVPVLVASRGVTSVVKREADGVYTDYLVTFTRSVAGCAWTGTLNNNGGFGPLPGWGPVMVDSDGNPDQPLGPPNQLRVKITDLNGNLVGIDENRTISVTATC